TSQPPTSQPPTGDCTVDYNNINDWGAGFQAQVFITNNSSTPIEGWQLQWTFPSGQQITQLWNGSYSQNGANVTVNNESWNSNIGPGQTIEFGFLATPGGGADPTAFTLNGTACSVS